MFFLFKRKKENSKRSRIFCSQVIPTRLSDGQVVLLLPNNTKNNAQIGNQAGNPTNLYCLAPATNIIQEQSQKNSNYVLNVIDLPNHDPDIYDDNSRSGLDQSLSPDYSDQPIDYTLHRKTQDESEDGSVWRPW